ncbi:MAG: hypothetical protein NWE89_15850 [Candidatus Bathyarchaeota archaeon]|nr:hypothetical protein [Candidatus Bathyarchaeota archaeon]
MGYTHYWSASRDFTDEEWKAIQTNARQILTHATDHYGISVSEEYDINSTPIVNNREIRFNGFGDEGHETFLLMHRVPEPPDYRRGEPDFNFCKTARKDYDMPVVAILIAARATAPDAFEWSSDGWLSELAEGVKLANEACGLDLEWANSDVSDNDPDRAKVTNVIDLEFEKDKRA